MKKLVNDNGQKYYRLSDLKKITNDKYRIAPKRIDELVTYKKIPLVIDVAFKTFFLNPNNFDIVTKFVSVLLEQDYDYLKEHLKPINNELPKEFVYEKASVADVAFKIVDDNGEIVQFIILEMNNNPSDNRIEKNYEYQYRLLRINVKMGSSKLTATTLYNLNNFNYEGIDRTILKFKQIECNCEYDEKLILNDLLENYEVSLPLILEKCYHKFEELTEREKWIAFFLTDDIELAEHLAEGEELMEKALKVIQEMNQDPDFILKYNTALDELQGERELAHKEGLNDGISIGRKNECIEIAKKLIAKNFKLEDISDVTGLSIEELNSINSSNI